MTLYEEEGLPEVVRLLRFEAGSAMPPGRFGNGAEVFVIEGDCHQDRVVLEQGSWARYPAGSRLGLASDGGCTLYFKTGHLPE